MNALTHWTRQEVIKLCGMTRGAFEFFEKMKLVQPLKLGTQKKPIVFYSWNQLVTIRAYAKLRENCRPKAIKEALEYLNPDNPSEMLRDKRLMAYQNRMYWVEDTPDNVYNVIVLSGKNAGQLILSFSVKELIDELEKDGKESDVIDFEQRFKTASKVA